MVDEDVAKKLADLCGCNALALSIVSGLIRCGAFNSKVGADMSAVLIATVQRRILPGSDHTSRYGHSSRCCLTC